MFNEEYQIERKRLNVEYITSISKSSDEDNCVSFNCPHCNERFKLEVNEYEEFDSDILYCPSCGLNETRTEFYSEDIREAAKIEIMNYVSNHLNSVFKGLSKNKSKNIRINMKPLKEESSPTLYEKDDLEILKTNCCDRIVKINPISYSIKPYCPYCGGVS